MRASRLARHRRAESLLLNHWYLDQKLLFWLESILAASGRGSAEFSLDGELTRSEYTSAHAAAKSQIAAGK
jgi:hypothetical protein